jgi:hypothetical protein
MSRRETKKPAIELRPEITLQPVVNIELRPGRTDGDVWLAAWCAVSASTNCVTRESADNWADHCLIQYKKRFGGKP